MDSTTVMLDSLHNADMIVDTTFNIKALLTETISNSTNNQFLQGGLLLGVLAWLAVQLKGIPIMLWERIDRLIRFTVYFDENNDFYLAFNRWYGEKHPDKFRNVFVRLRPENRDDSDGESYYLNDSASKKFRIIVNQYTDFNTFRYKGRLLFLSKSRKEFQNASSKDNAYLDSYSVYGFFAKKVLRELMEEIKAFREGMYSDTKLEIYYNSHSARWERRDFPTYKTFDKIFNKSKSDLVVDINNFVKNKDAYQRIGLPFKKGYLLYGPPGNGKTSMVIAMADYLKMGLYIFNLSSISDDVQFIELMNDIPPSSVILFEDIDTYIINRFGEKDKSPVSFSALLNALNGVYEPKDAIIVITTNNVSALDAALIRAGRIDKKIHVDNPTWEEIFEFVKFFFNVDYHLPIPEENIPTALCMADVQTICLDHMGGNVQDVIQALYKLEIEKKLNGTSNKGHGTSSDKVEV